MAVAARCYFTTNNAKTAVATTGTIPYTGWTAILAGNTAPVNGDLLVVVGLFTLGSGNVTQSGGTGSWTFKTANGNANAGSLEPYTSWCAWKNYVTADTAPAFAWSGTTTAYAYYIVALYSDAGGTVSLDASGAVKVDTTAATGHTPNTASATGSGEMAVVLNAARYTATGTGHTVTMTTPCSGFSVVGAMGGYAGASTGVPNSVSAYSKTPVGSGTVTPGAETFNEAVYNNAYTLLIAETVSKNITGVGAPVTTQGGTGTAVGLETSPYLEVYGFSVTGPVSGDCINYVAISVTEYQATSDASPLTFELWDYSGTPAQLGADQTGTASTDSSNISTALITGVTYAMLSTLRVRVYSTQPSGSGHEELVDAVGLVVNYTVTSTGGAASVTGAAAHVTAQGGVGTVSAGAGITGIAAPVTVAGGVGAAKSEGKTAGIAAPVTVQGGAGTFAGSANATGVAAPVIAAGGTGVLSASQNLTGTGAQVTAAGGTGTFAGSANVTGTGAQVTVAGGTGTAAASGAQNVTGVGAQVTVAGGAGTLSAGQNITGTGASITVQGGLGTPAGSGAANVSGVAAPVTVQDGAGTPKAGVGITGIAAAVTVQGGLGTPAGSGAANVSGVAAQVAIASGTGAAAGAAGSAGQAAPVTVAGGSGVFAANAHVTGMAALVAVLGGVGLAQSLVPNTKGSAVATVGEVAGSTATVTEMASMLASVRGGGSTVSVGKAGGSTATVSENAGITASVG